MASTYPAAAIRSPKAPIRIVPLRVDERLTAPAPAAPPGRAPRLTYRGGPLLTAVQVFTFFWGDATRYGTDGNQASGTEIEASRRRPHLAH